MPLKKIEIISKEKNKREKCFLRVGGTPHTVTKAEAKSIVENLCIQFDWKFPWQK